MKNITRIYITAAAILAVFILPSCNKDFLEVTPKGRLIAQTTSDYNLLLSNLDFLNIGATAQIPMGDEVVALEPYFSGSALRTQRLFRWDDVIYEPDANAAEMAVPMRNIYAYNKVINEVMSSTDGTEPLKKSLQAEAMAGRAWTYFLLINYFGKPFNATTSSTDLGYPIVKEADVTTTSFTRATVKEVYDFIVEDLTTAIPNLPAQTTHRLRMSKAAAEGLLGKVYVFMGRFNDALPHLNAAITDFSSATIPVRLYDYNVTFGPGGIFLPIGIVGPTYPTVPNNEEIAYGKQASNDWTFFNDEILLKPQTLALYDSSDLRRKFHSTTSVFGGPAYPAGLIRRTGPGTTLYGVMVPEIYLLRAEVKARLNDLAGAKADLEALRIKRMPAIDAPVPPAIAADQTALVKFILEERIREFAVQGFRWFDMRRLSVDPVYNTTVGYTHTLFSETGVPSDYTLRPERLTLKLPQKVINENPGMPNND